MMIHPVMLYTGFTGFALPFSFAFAALVTGELGTTWFRTTRRWTLFAWSVLSVGIMLGGRWAYEVLGWGGYWAWDPVENASLMPWIAGTAYLHSVMIQEKRDMLKTWNLVLIGLTYALCLFGTFLTRSGVVQSVHAFTNSRQLRAASSSSYVTILARRDLRRRPARTGACRPTALAPTGSRACSRGKPASSSTTGSSWRCSSSSSSFTMFPVFSEMAGGVRRMVMGPPYCTTPSPACSR